MSFNDLERGIGPPPSAARASEDGRFIASANRIALDVFKMDSNVTGISKLVDLLGTPKDGAAIRKKLHDLTESTRILAKTMPADLKQLATLADSSQGQQLQQAKLARDLQKSVLAFQNVQRRSAERQRHFVDRAKADLAQSTPPLPPEDDAQLVEMAPQRSSQQQQQQTVVEGIPDSELEFQEALIEEREHEIRGIETGVLELNEIFRDLGQIVETQGSMLDNIEQNVQATAVDVEGASGELAKAHDYQRKAGRRLFCLLIIFVIVLAVVLLAILV